MKKLIIVFILLLVLSSVLFAEKKVIEGVEEKNPKITVGGIIGIFFLLVFIILFYFVFIVIVYGGRSDSDSIETKIGKTLILKLREMLDTGEDEIDLKFVIKKIAGNQITLQCKIYKGGKFLLTKAIGVDKTKKVTEKIKKMLTWPIDISVSYSESREEINVEAERIIPEAEDNFFLYPKYDPNF